MYIVEIRQDGDGLVAPIADIRTWLDHRHIQPSVFRLSLIPGRTNLPPGIQSRERGGSVRGSLFRTGDRGRAPRRCRCVSRFRLVLLGTGFLLETSRKPLKPIRERAKLIGAAQIVP